VTGYSETQIRSELSIKPVSGKFLFDAEYQLLFTAIYSGHSVDKYENLRPCRTISKPFEDVYSTTCRRLQAYLLASTTSFDDGNNPL